MVRIRRLFLCFIILAALSSACSVSFAGRPPTPVPTIHLPTPIVPTLTPTPEPTPTPTLPPKIEVSNERFEVLLLEDGGTLFFDKEIGYMLEFGPEWLVIPVEETTRGEYLSLVQDVFSQRTAHWLTEFYINDNILRLAALDYSLQYSGEGAVISNFGVSYRHDDWSATTALNDVLMYQAAVLPTLMPNMIVTDQTIKTNASGIQYARLESKSTNEFGEPVRQVMLMVKHSNGVLVFIGSARENFFSTVEPIFQQIFDSLLLVE